jgi:predicted  nucleic acid-binding Zn-ribbon protein
MREDIRGLLKVQSLDMEIRELESQTREIDAGLEAIRSQIENAQRVIREEKDREISSRLRTGELELEVEEKKNLIDKYHSQLFKIKNNREYTALLHEIEGIKSDIRILEDRMLEVMEKGEGERNLTKEAEADLEQARVRYREEEKKALGQLEHIADKIAEKQEARIGLAQSLECDLREGYEIIFSHRSDRAVVKVRNGVCTGCNMELTAQVQTDLAREEMVCQCENCGRFIFLPEEKV